MPVWRARYPLRGLALFGSWARGEQAESSDVDLLAEVDPSIGLDFVALADDVENALGLPVDLVSARAISPRYRKAIQPDLVDV